MRSAGRGLRQRALPCAMTEPVSRRDLLKQLGTAGAGVVLARGSLDAQGQPILVAGRPVEIVASSVSPSTVRITVLPVEGPGGMPAGGSLVSAAAGRALSRRRVIGSDPVTAGQLRLRVTGEPPTVHVETAAGRTVQKLTFDPGASTVSFLLGKGPLLGFGEGGPQFDRKGMVDIGRSGQGGYQLRTHGGRVPIQWFVGTDGWGMYVHRPLGSFDLTGSEGRLSAPDDAAPLYIFVTASSDPRDIIREYATFTGRAELPARWTFGYMKSNRTLAGTAEVMWVA